MTRRKKMLLIAGFLLVVGVGLATMGYIGEHKRDVAAAQRGEQPEENDDSSPSIAAFVAIFAALLAASQARKSKKDSDPDG